MKYRALALDLDGTLMNSEKKLSAGNKEAIFRAIDAGVAVILATGRPLLGVMPVAEELEFHKRGGYVCAYNGGKIVECRSNEAIVERLLPQGSVAVINQAARDAGVYACTYTKDQIVAESDTDEYVIKEAFCNGTTVKKVDDLAEFVDYPVTKCLVVGEHEKLLGVQTVLKEHFGDELDAFFSESYFLEVVPPGVEKASGLALIMEALGIRREELIACGDGMNDLPMIEYAGLGIAMENAYPPVKEGADLIAPSNDEDGVAWVIEKFMLG